MADETWRKLFGEPGGLWLLLTGEVGTISPPTITISAGYPARLFELRNLGTPSDVVTRVHARLREAFPGTDVQQFLAERLGVGQQAVSRYVRGSEPQLMPDGWSQLVRMDFATPVLEVPRG